MKKKSYRIQKKAITYLHHGLLDTDTNTFAIQALASVTDEAELEVDANLLARALGELESTSALAQSFRSQSHSPQHSCAHPPS
jgi:hypothetical protein